MANFSSPWRSETILWEKRMHYERINKMRHPADYRVNPGTYYPEPSNPAPVVQEKPKPQKKVNKLLLLCN